MITIRKISHHSEIKIPPVYVNLHANEELVDDIMTIQW